MRNSKPRDERANGSSNGWANFAKQATDAYKAVQDFKSANNIIVGSDGQLTSEVELNQLGISLAKARADTSQAQAKLDRITRVLQERTAFNPKNLNIPDPVVTDALSSPVITKLRQQFLEDQNKVGRMERQIRGEPHGRPEFAVGYGNYSAVNLGRDFSYRRELQERVPDREKPGGRDRQADDRLSSTNPPRQGKHRSV